MKPTFCLLVRVACLILLSLVLVTHAQEAVTCDPSYEPAADLPDRQALALNPITFPHQPSFPLAVVPDAWVGETLILGLLALIVALFLLFGDRIAAELKLPGAAQIGLWLLVAGLAGLAIQNGTRVYQVGKTLDNMAAQYELGNYEQVQQLALELGPRQHPLLGFMRIVGYLPAASRPNIQHMREVNAIAALGHHLQQGD